MRSVNEQTTHRQNTLAMKPVTNTLQAEIRYWVALMLLGIAIVLIILVHLGVGCLVGGVAFSLTCETAQKNGHFTQFGKKKHHES